MHRKLRLQESDARSKTKVRDHRAPKDGQGCRKQLCLPEIAQKTSRSVDGPGARCQVPRLRVAAGFPSFSNTAMDMVGPLQIKLNGRTLQEAQVVIFTCTTTRAIHLELVTDKSTEFFLMAFRRFARLHGHPSVCWCDYGWNFFGVQEYLRECMQHWDIPKIESAISEEFACDFKWQWDTPHASHQNGVLMNHHLNCC